MMIPPDRNQTLYRRVLGEAFDRLPVVLRTFHDQPSGGVAQGQLRVVRGRGWLRSGLATLMGLPPPGEQVPIRLEVQVVGDQEYWVRHFGASRFVTRQWQQGEFLMDAAGPARLALRLTADATGMQFSVARCWMLGLPMPSALAPRVNAVARGEEGESWWLQVRVEVPLLGLLTQYEGKVTPEYQGVVKE